MTCSKRKDEVEIDDCDGDYWNERVIVRTDEQGNQQYAIHEVFYENYRPTNWTKEPVAPIGDSFDELREAVEHFRSALDAPILFEVKGSDGNLSLVDEEGCSS